MKAFFNWSGGKDSALALYKVLEGKEYDVRMLTTTLSRQYGRISMHGVREELLEAQTKSIGIPLKKIWLPEMPSMDDYDSVMNQELKDLSSQGLSQAIFGDIFLEDLRKYREDKLALAGIKPSFPLWKQDTHALIHEFIELGFQAIVVCIDESVLDKTFAGRLLNAEFINDLPAGVDPCGENGEYHSFVLDGPIFTQPIPFEVADKVHRRYQDPSDPQLKTGYWYQDISLPGD